MFYIFTTAAIVIGVLLDFIIGDPEGWWHPVRFMGAIIKEIEAKLRSRIANNPHEKRRAGLLLWVSVIIPGAILFASWQISQHLYLVVASVMCYQIMATKCLRDESMKVKEVLDEGDIYTARIRLSRIVGRDTEKLDEEHVIRGAVETVAENTCDGAVAPLFYMALMGPVGGFFYKAINTMDSMIGYRNDIYEDFGRFAARADDVANFIPARLAARLMMLAARILKMDYARAAMVYERDRSSSDSPNSGHCESVVAGALRIQLLGDAYYGGKLFKKPALGDRLRDPEPEDIEKTGDLLYLTVILAVVVTLVWRMVCALLMGLI